MYISSIIFSVYKIHVLTTNLSCNDSTHFKKERFALNILTPQNASKFAIFMDRDLIFLVLFIFPIPRINNTENNTIKEYSILTKKIFRFFILLHFSPFQTILSIFWKSPFLGPKRAHIMGFWAENHPFGVFSYKCLELSNSSRNGIKIQSWIVLNSIE